MNSRRLILGPKPDSPMVSTELAPLKRECPLWVKSGHVQCSDPCPLYPQ